MSNLDFTFSSIDYALFGITLGLTFIIGIYYAYRGKKQKTSNKSNDYLNATKSMAFFPVAISLCVTYQSSSYLLAIPTEVYLYGSIVIWSIVVTIVAPIFVGLIFVPTYFRCGVTCVHEYLRLRFNRRMQVIGAVAFLSSSTIFSAISIYAPALAIEAVTGLSLWTSIITCGIICTAYTTLGGLRGVIWSDVFLSFILYGGILAILIKGTQVSGGISEVWKVAVEDGRFDIFNFETDIRIRHTFWSIVFGGMVTNIAVLGTSVTPVQRYLSCKSTKEAQKSMCINIIGQIFLDLIVILLGLIIYSTFRGCDPIGQQCIQKADQILPLAVMKLFYDIPGIPGLFLSAILAAALSTISSSINSLAAATMDNMVKPFTQYSDRTYLFVSKGVVFFFGIVAVGFAALMTYTTELFEISTSLFSLTLGPILGMYTLAMQFPFVNWMGAAGGLLCGIASTTWVFLGKQSIRQSNEFVRRLSLSTDLCNASCILQAGETNFTTLIYSTPDATIVNEISSVADQGVMFDDNVPFYTISYRYLSAVGLLACLISGIVISLLTCGWKDRHNVDPKLLRPFFDLWIFRCWIPANVRRFLRFGIDWSEDDDDMVYDIQENKEISENKKQICSFKVDDHEKKFCNGSFSNEDNVSINFTKL
ncbi:sodium-coupled monocarboxylate transporter 1-like [Styela clava]